MADAESISEWLNNFRELNEITDPGSVNISDKKKYDVPIGDVLSAIHSRNLKFYDKLTDEEKKKFSLWNVMRFTSSATTDTWYYAIAVNKNVNKNFNVMTKEHQGLLWRLLAICGTGVKKTHNYIHPPKGLKKNKLEELLSEYFPLLKHKDIELLLELNTKDSWKEFLRLNGYDDKSIEDILKNA